MKPPSIAKLSMIPAKQSEAGPKRELCQRCALHETCEQKFVRPFIPERWSGKLLLVLEGAAEASVGPWAGDEGRLLRRLLKQAGYQSGDVGIVFALRCAPAPHEVKGDRPPRWARDEPRKRPSMLQVRACRPFVLKTIEYFNPKTVIAFGDTAVRSILNKTAPALVHLRGRKLSVAGLDPSPVVYATYDMATVFGENNAHLRDAVSQDLERPGWQPLGVPAVQFPNEDVVAIDTEYVGDKLLTIGLADLKHAKAVDVADTKEFVELVERIKEPFLTKTLLGHAIEGDVDHLVALGLGREEWVTGERAGDPRDASARQPADVRAVGRAVEGADTEDPR